MNRLVKIEPELLTEMLEYVIPFPTEVKSTAESFDLMTAKDGTQYNEITRRLAEAILAESEEVFGGCDHSVGICECGNSALIEAFSLRLQGERLCPKCNGEMFIYHAPHNPRCDEYNKQGFDCDEAHYEDCGNCGKTGKVAFDL